MCINLLFVITSNVAVSVAVAHATVTELVIAVNLTSTKSCDRSIKSGSGKTSSKLIRNPSTKIESFSLLGPNITGSKSSTVISIDEEAEALHKTICSCPQHPCLLFSITTIANEQELFQIYSSFNTLTCHNGSGQQEKKYIGKVHFEMAGDQDGDVSVSVDDVDACIMQCIFKVSTHTNYRKLQYKPFYAVPTP